MANTLIHKKSSVASKIPLTTDLSLGEIAVNTFDGIIYTKKNDGVESVIPFKQINKGNIEQELIGTITSHDHDFPTYTSTTTVNEGYHRLATLSLASPLKTCRFKCKATTPTGVVSESIVTVLIGYNSGNTASTNCSITAESSHSYDSRSSSSNGWVTAYFRVSFDATNAFIDVYDYKATADTYVVMPLIKSDWVFNTGLLTYNPTVGSVDSQVVDTYLGLCSPSSVGRTGYANSSNSSSYSQYGIYGGRTLSDTVDKTGKWELIGTLNYTYTATYLNSKCYNIDLLIKETTIPGAIPLSDLEDFTITIKSTLPVHTDTTTFNSVVPDHLIEISGRNKILPTDVAILTYSTSTAAKVCRVYIKLKNPNTHYEVLPINRYACEYNATNVRSTGTYFDLNSLQATATSLPAPAQGTIVYGVTKSRTSKNDIDSVLPGPSVSSYEHTQGSASATWTITHNLNTRLVDVIVSDDTYVKVVPDSISFNSVNQCTLVFYEAVSGFAKVIG